MDHLTATPAPLSDAPLLHREPTAPLTPAIPCDIVYLIVDMCLDEDEPDRRHCAQALALTCQTLRERAQQALWEQVELPDTSQGWVSARLRAIYTTPRLADMVTSVRWNRWDQWDAFSARRSRWEPEMPDWVLPRIEQLFRVCRNISRVYLGNLKPAQLPHVLDAVRASNSRSTLNDIELHSTFPPNNLRLTEADLQRFLLSFPSLTSFTIDFFVNPPSLTSSNLLNLHTLDLVTDERDNQYQSLLDSINPHTLREVTTSDLDWLCRPGFSLDTIWLFTPEVGPPLVLAGQLTRLLPFHPNLRDLDIESELWTPREDSGDLAAFCQILSILPPTLRSLCLPFGIIPEHVPIQQLITDSPCKQLVRLRCWNSDTRAPLLWLRADETAEWSEE
ncbi:hypothetical protein JCM5296_004507 [Sporobolomyces johnsonii]